MSQTRSVYKSTNKTLVSTPKARGDSGIYNQHPSPGLAKYPATKGPGDIDEKFAETGVGDANTQKNQLRQAKGVNRTGKAPAVTSSNMMHSKNAYKKVGKTKQF